MFWAACNLAYFGFLHSAEFTAPNLASCVCHPLRSCGRCGGLSFVSLVLTSSHKGFKNRSFLQGLFYRLLARGSFHFFPVGIFDTEGRCLRPIIPVSGWTAFILCLTDFMVVWHFVCSGYSMQFFQPQLSDWSSNCSIKFRTIKFKP